MFAQIKLNTSMFLQIATIVLIYGFTLYFGVNQMIDFNLVGTTFLLFGFTLIFYYVRNTYVLNSEYLERFLFLLFLCIFIYNIVNGNYYIFISAILYVAVQLLKYNLVANDKIAIFLTNVKKDDQTLDEHFRESFFIFDILRSFRPVCTTFIIFFGVLSIYTEFTYGFMFISMSTTRFFVCFYLIVTFLLLCVSLYSINCMNTPTIMPLFKTCATCAKHVFIGGGFFFGMATTCVPIFTPPECYNENLLNKFQQSVGIPLYRTEEETNAFRQAQFYKVWDNKFQNKDATLTNGRIDPTKMNALMQKIPSEMYWGRKK
jgi:hypothetical protein